MNPNTWMVFFAAMVGLSLMPGPNGLLVLNHGARYGQRLALFTIAGGVLGFVLLLALCMFGVGALLQASPKALLVMQCAGGAYLAWLGVQVWRSPPMRLEGTETLSARQAWGLFRQGWITAVSNPKVLLFFGAFLPQFIDLEHRLATQFAVMAATFAAIEFCTEWLMARFAVGIRGWMQATGPRFNQVCGALFVVIGAVLVLGR